MTTFRAMLLDEEGASMVEYALVLALISLAAIVALEAMQTQLSLLLTNVGNALASASASGQ